MKTTDPRFVTEMADTFETAIIEALRQKSDAFSFPYAGDPASGPAGVATEMKCLVLLMPAPLADLMQEGIPAIRENLAGMLTAMGAEVTPVAGKQ